jgi:hypothetical protein
MTLLQRKRMRQRNKSPINQHNRNPTSKQDGWWATELISRTCNKPHLTEGGADKQLPLKGKTTGESHQPPGETETELLHKF